MKMKTRYKIPIVTIVCFTCFWAFIPTIALYACAEFDLDWKDTLFCNVNGKMIGNYFVYDDNWWSNPVIQLINQVINSPSCTHDENNKSLPLCGIRTDIMRVENEN